jgi:Xaa-Pro aminopeptidase
MTNIIITRRARLERVRWEITGMGLDGFLVPKRDRFGNSEFLPPAAEDFAWLTGFTGSNGMAVVLPDTALVSSDTRYTAQMKTELDPGAFQSIDDRDKLGPWLAANVKPGQKIGYDAWLHTAREIGQLRPLFEAAGATLVSCRENPLVETWADRPPETAGRIVTHPLKYAGRTWRKKLAWLATVLKARKADALISTDLACNGWALNIRGKGDIPYAPLPLAFAIITAGGGVRLYCDQKKPTSLVRRRARIKSLDDFARDLAALGKKQATVLIDPDTAPSIVVESLSESGARLVKEANPCLRAKAVKNETEIKGAQAAHVRDGTAFTYLISRMKIALGHDPRYWSAKLAGLLPGRPVTELDVAAWMEEQRQSLPLYKGPSFPTIAAADRHGDTVHYVATPETSCPIKKSCLVDTGAQFLDGTTDATRTVCDGKPSNRFKKGYTLVLKGLIALTTQVFSPGTRGIQLDAFARQFLWNHGLNFGHGTSHGVGSYLTVHESPPRISYGVNEATLAPLEPNNILSIEPGWYPIGEFGIRLEHLVVVREVRGFDRKMLGFEVLTLAPFDLDAIDFSLITHKERLWLNNYHRRVRETLTPLLDDVTAAWLRDATSPIGADVVRG